MITDREQLPSQAGRTEGTREEMATGGYKAIAATDTTVLASQPVAALRFAWTDWLSYLDDQDISEEQKRELIETLWSIVVSFVDLSWRLGPDSGDDGKALDLTAVLAALDSGNGKETE